MSFYIDPSGGIAGDMFSAMLISAGAPKDKMIDGMVTAARKLGIAEITSSSTKDGSTRLNIHFHSKHEHIKGSKAKEILKELYDELDIQCHYREFGDKALDILIKAERQAHSENHFESDHYHINPIGVVKSPYTNKAPFRPDPNAEGDFYIELFQKYEDGLKNLDQFSHMYLIVYLDKSIGYSLHVNPPHHNVNVGVFASRSPFRPNPIGINIVEIKKIDKNRVYISPVDFIDNTPVLDIKPVIKSLDKVEGANNGWINSEEMKDENVVITEGSKHNHDHGDAYLHEAQDIVIDIIGAVIGMQHLMLDTEAFITKSVSVGGGMVKFSHGKLAVPSPATRIILDKYNIPFQMGPIEVELCTPTGAAIIAALNVELKETNDNLKVIGTSRGTKDLDIPPLKMLK